MIWLLVAVLVVICATESAKDVAARRPESKPLPVWMNRPGSVVRWIRVPFRWLFPWFTFLLAGSAVCFVIGAHLVGHPGAAPYVAGGGVVLQTVAATLAARGGSR